MPGRARWLGCGLLVLGALVARLWLASRLPLLTDECLYWVWSHRLAAGYFDQPPLIAWSLAAQRAVFGDSPLALRIVPLVLGAALPWILMRHAGDPWRWTLWCTGLPVFFGLTLVATPDAWLLGAWALALAGALAGGPGWLLAGVAAGLAGLAKYSGLAVLPLAILAVGPREWRSPWMWAGALATVALMAPNVAWNMQHEWLTVRFQWFEGVASDRSPGPIGPLLQVLGQLFVVGPVAAIAGGWWAVRGSGTWDRTDRICWGTSVPVLALFAVSALGGPPEAHWPAPAWIGVGLGLSRVRGGMGRLAEIGSWMGLLASAVLAVHCFVPLVPLPADPAARFWEAPTLAGPVAAWALPAGRVVGEARGQRVVLTERYQEAAAIAYYARVEARALAGCGRSNQYDLWPAPTPVSALFVRPTTGGPPTCLDGQWDAVSSANRIHGVDPAGRTTGRWQVFELGPPVE